MLYLFQIWVIFVSFVAFFGLLFFPALVLSILPFRLRLRCVQPLWSWFSLIILKVGCFSRLTLIDRRAPQDKEYPAQGVYISNHQGLLDIPLLITQFQIPPIMIKEVLYIPFFGFLGWACGALIVSRGKRNSRKKVFEQTRNRLLKDKMAVQYYPEGTRSKDHQVKPYKEIKITLLQLAYQENLPVVACSIWGTRSAFENQNLIKPFQKMAVIIHPRIEKKEGETIGEFCERCWKQVELGHSELESMMS